MADVAKRAEKNIRQLKKCSICKSAFTDPRMLPCIHTFCSECLKRTSEATLKKPGDTMPCPLCREEFTIPQEGIVGLQKNAFMENLLEFKTTLKSNDPTLNIGNKTEDEMKRIINMKYCSKHIQKPLDYYCADCKKIVCVSCFVENHKLHDCKDVTTVDEEFRQMIEKYALKTSNYADEMLSLKMNAQMRKTDFLKKIAENETAIIERSQEIKNMIDEQTKSLLHELSLIKSYHVKEMENKVEEIDMQCTILRSFEAYCTELRAKGSASDICSSVDEIMVRANELERDHEAFIGRPHQSVEVSFQKSDLVELLRNFNNVLGQIKDTTAQLENYAVVVGINDGLTITKDVLKINLHRSNEISAQEQIPTTMAPVAVSAVYCNTMYVTGIGVNKDEIWKYNMASGWKKCASLAQGRSRHCGAFIEEVLYNCGGFVDSNKRVLDSVEGYNAITNKSTTTGKLFYCVQNSGNCVPFEGSLYIFGGADKDYKTFNHVQLYNTKENTCSVFSRPMPLPSSFPMGAIVWDKSVILLGDLSCFIFNFETETWQERKQFKTDVVYFGLALDNGRVFVIGGGTGETDKDGKIIWKCRDDVCYVPLQNILQDKPIEWKVHGKLPKPSFVYAYANMDI